MAETIANPDSPVEILKEVIEAARRITSPTARDSAGLTPLGVIADEEFTTLANLLVSTPGTTIHDARAFIWAARKMAMVFNDTVTAGQPNWEVYAFYMALLDRMYECIDAMAAEATQSGSACVLRGSLQ